MKKILSNLAGVILILSCCVAAQQQSGTPFQIRVNTDANGYLVLSGAAQSLPLSQPTVFANTRLQTDSSGNLLVVVSGAISPTTITCNGSTGTTNTVLTGGNPCTWTGTPSITSVTVGNGTVNAPAFSFSAAPTTGFYRTGGNNLRYSGGGSVDLSLNENGSGQLQLPSGGWIGFSSTSAASGAADIVLSRSTAKTLKIDTDGTGGALTLVSIISPLSLGGKISTYNNISTAGSGVPYIVAAANITAQSAAATITSYANPAADGDFDIRAQMSVTASTTLVTTITCTYTDVANVARSMIMPSTPLSGTFTAAGAITGAGASIWETPVMHIRAKASTTITLLTSTGTFTGVTYSASGIITQLN